MVIVNLGEHTPVDRRHLEVAWQRFERSSTDEKTGYKFVISSQRSVLIMTKKTTN